ncbi:hypothetical protein IAD21_01291 [Abditibacteriota bacterium]|nr:hypothetical protein IAD21_01291 [Abditibacteriota bacterium]
MKLFTRGLTLLGLLASIPSTRADSRTNPPIADGLRFELRLPEGKTRFQQGETIPIRLLFSNRSPQTLCLDTFHNSPPLNMAVFASFEVSPGEGATNPLGDLPTETGYRNGLFNGPPPPVPQVLSEKPIEVPLVLNEYIRFDRPGTFQICATTNYVFAVAPGQPIPTQGSFFGRGPSVSSIPLPIEIVPANPTWQQEQIKLWRDFWAKQKQSSVSYEWYTPIGVHPPTNDLRFLNTQSSAQTIIEHQRQDIYPPRSSTEADFWRSGLIGFSDRLWLIGAMKTAIKEPDYPVTQGFLDNLATLQALYHQTQTGPTPVTDLIWKAKAKATLANWQLTFNYLTSKKGVARAITVHSLLELACHSEAAKAPQVRQKLPHLVTMVPDVFNDLPELPQHCLLVDQYDSMYGVGEWNLIKSPRLVAPLVREWQKVPHAEEREMWMQMRTGDLILRHLYELSPKTTRPLILKEMAAPQPRASFKVLSLLEDKYLLQLQNIWWAHLNSNGANQDTAALLIGRYADSSLKARVEREYARRKRDKTISYEVGVGLSRYLARVDS